MQNTKSKAIALTCGSELEKLLTLANPVNVVDFMNEASLSLSLSIVHIYLLFIFIFLNS